MCRYNKDQQIFWNSWDLFSMEITSSFLFRPILKLAIPNDKNIVFHYSRYINYILFRYVSSYSKFVLQERNANTSLAFITFVWTVTSSVTKSDTIESPSGFYFSSWISFVIETRPCNFENILYVLWRYSVSETFFNLWHI